MWFPGVGTSARGEKVSKLTKSGGGLQLARLVYSCFNNQVALTRSHAICCGGGEVNMTPSLKVFQTFSTRNGSMHWVNGRGGKV
ncbi:hypothetical protein CFELI_01775 [Corynebacterium felinum]|uniref:Uncharacterized protein n=1 Tax=Corynebacterium felinum TaxID=131318 RepID=A0ABU2B7P3_9CORY|nr:hypothetical protein [Corynebacterium felinum]WJY93998.1 hypothetical protein CFELI_01775 [Corynebacterium felinum]